jgi:hypothetical protein
MKGRKNKNLIDYLNIFFEFFDSIDRKLYGNRLNISIYLSMILAVILPFLSFISNSEFITLFNKYATYLGSFFVCTVILAWLGSMRDDGDWNWEIIIKNIYSRIKIYYYIFLEKFSEFNDKDREDKIYYSGIWLTLFGVCIRGLYIVLIFIRGTIEKILSNKLTNFYSVDIYISYFGFGCITIGLVVLIIAFKKNPQYFKNKLSASHRNLHSEVQVWDQLKITNEFVVSLSDDIKMGTILSKCNSPLLYDFIKSIKTWNPNSKYYECSYQDRLFKHLLKNLPSSEIALEYPLKDISNNNQKLRADLVIDDTILIEIKHHPNSATLQKAKGQVEDYLNIWKGKGPVILLLCHADFELTKRSLEQFISDQNKLNKVIFALVLEG